MTRGRAFPRAWQGTAAAFAAVLMLPLAPANAGAARQTTHVVEIRSLSFVLPEPPVRRGDVIVWINKDIVPHTATAKDGTWDSGNLDPGQSWRMTVRTAGILAFTCAYHPVMSGRIDIGE